MSVHACIYTHTHTDTDTHTDTLTHTHARRHPTMMSVDVCGCRKSGAKLLSDLQLREAEIKQLTAGLQKKEEV